MGAGVIEEEQPPQEELAKEEWESGYAGISLFPTSSHLPVPSLANPVRSHFHRRLGNTACKGQHPRAVCKRKTEQEAGEE